METIIGCTLALLLCHCSYTDKPSSIKFQYNTYDIWMVLKYKNNSRTFSWQKKKNWKFMDELAINICSFFHWKKIIYLVWMSFLLFSIICSAVVVVDVYYLDRSHRTKWKVLRIRDIEIHRRAYTRILSTNLISYIIIHSGCKQKFSSHTNSSFEESIYNIFICRLLKGE